MAGLARCDQGGRLASCVEIGWRLASAHWGRGYATEAGHVWLDHGFSALGLEEIVAFTDTGHRRSRAVMDQLGMTRDPARDFAHPGVPPDHPLSAHVLNAAHAPARGNRTSAAPAFPP
jgi:RimJ/RimL family protein N-acetyltransferase